MGVAEEAIRAALAGFAPPEMRLGRERVAGITIINDAYNANPDSMLAALRTLREVAVPGSRRVAVLGDMLEMGAAGPEAHREIGRAVAREGLADAVVLVGPLAEMVGGSLAGSPVEVWSIDSVGGDGAALAASRLCAGDTVLLKGSRGVGLERVLGALRASGAGVSASSPGGVS